MDSRTLDINRSTDPPASSSGRRSFWTFLLGVQLPCIAWLVLVVLASLLLLTHLNYPLFEPDETRNAQLAMNVLESGNWISLTLNDEPYWNKPPALIWAIAVCYQQFGISPSSTRLPGAIAAVVTVLLMYGFGQKLVGRRAAFIGTIALLLCSGFVVIGRWVVMDATFSCCAVTMGWALILANQNLRSGLRSRYRSLIEYLWLVLAGAAGGWGMMLKGPVILVLVAPPVLLAYWRAGELRFFLHRRMLGCAIAFLVVAAPWYLVVSVVDPGFYSHFFWHHHVVRFSNAFDHEAPWWFYLPMIFVMMFPASYLLPSLARFLIAQLRLKEASEKTPSSSVMGYLLLAGLWPVLFFSFSESKLPTYILPSLPFLCLLVGVMLEAKLFPVQRTINVPADNQNDLRKPRRPFWSLIPHISPLGFVAILAMVVLGTRWYTSAQVPVPMVVLVWVWIALLIVALIPWIRSCRPEVAWGSVAITGLGLMMGFSHVLLPGLASMRSTHEAIAVLKHDSPSAPVVFFDRHPYAAGMTLPEEDVYYFKFDQILAFRDFVTEHPDSIVIASEKKLGWLDRTLQDRVTFRKSGDYIHVGIPQVETESGVRLARGVEK